MNFSNQTTMELMNRDDLAVYTSGRLSIYTVSPVQVALHGDSITHELVTHDSNES